MNCCFSLNTCKELRIRAARLVVLYSVSATKSNSGKGGVTSNVVTLNKVPMLTD
jgi:hypothetical protein